VRFAYDNSRQLQKNNQVLRRRCPHVRTGIRQTTTPSSDTSGPVITCFNCGSKSHIASSCTKSRIKKGACYQYGSITHQRSKCPDLGRTATRQVISKRDTAAENETGMMNVTSKQPDLYQNHPGPYKATCVCNFPVDPDTLCGITSVAIINTCSPISKLKRELLPGNSDIIKPLENDCIFSGINGTKLEFVWYF